MIMNRKGYILIVATVLLMVAAIASVAFYNAVYLAGKMQGIEVTRIRGYYAASAGLSYASVILAGKTIPSSPISVKATYPQLWTDLGLTGSEDVIITYTTHAGGGYDVTSTFTF